MLPSEIDIYSYLRLRFFAIAVQEKVVILLIDEVYTAAKMEYHAGEFVGLAANGIIAKTLLVYFDSIVAWKIQKC